MPPSAGLVSVLEFPVSVNLSDLGVTANRQSYFFISMNTNENVLKSYQQAPDIPDPLGIQWIHPDFTECIMNIVMHHLVADNLKAMQCSQIELKYSIAFRNWKLFKLLLLERAQMVRRAEKNSKSSYFFADEFPSCTGHEFGIGLQILSGGGYRLTRDFFKR